MYPHKYLYANVHGSIIHNSPKIDLNFLQQVNRYIHKWIISRQQKGIIDTKTQLISKTSCYMKEDIKNYISYNCIYRIFSEKETIVTQNRSVQPGMGAEIVLVLS